MIRTMIFCALVLAIGTSSYADDDGPTYAERLGWPEGSKVVIFHNDDAGLCHDTNLGSIRSLEEGVVTSWSVMMPCPWVPEIAEYLERNPEVCSGLHLTLNSEWNHYRWRPVADASAVPGLIDEDGYMHSSSRDTAQHATADEVETEIRAQIALAERMGLPITHLDTHMGTIYARPDFLERYVQVGIEKNIPVMMPAGHMAFIRMENPEALAAKELILDLAQRLWDAGLPLLDDLHTASYSWKTAEKTDLFIDVVRNLEPGVTQIIVHAIEPSPNFDAISTSGDVRAGDLYAMIDPRLREVIEEEGIILTTWRELHERRAQLDGD